MSRLVVHALHASINLRGAGLQCDGKVDGRRWTVTFSTAMWARSCRRAPDRSSIATPFMAISVDESRPAEVVVPRSNAGHESTPLRLPESKDRAVHDLGVADGKSIAIREPCHLHTRTTFTSCTPVPYKADRAVVQFRIPSEFDSQGLAHPGTMPRRIAPQRFRIRVAAGQPSCSRWYSRADAIRSRLSCSPSADDHMSSNARRCRLISSSA
jgi:hypothetical protein